MKREREIERKGQRETETERERRRETETERQRDREKEHIGVRRFEVASDYRGNQQETFVYDKTDIAGTNKRHLFMIKQTSRKP